jgi:hypothetical protein
MLKTFRFLLHLAVQAAHQTRLTAFPAERVQKCFLPLNSPDICGYSRYWAAPGEPLTS